jgi:NADH-quinone oxidoreductase subunit J
MGAEFLAMILVVVYVGAVAVLFLFVVMMLDVDFAALRKGSARYLPIGAMVAGLLTAEMIVVSLSAAGSGAASTSTGPATVAVAGDGHAVTNAEAIGRVLYTDYVYFFQAAGLILLVAMIGAIVLTLKHRAGIKRQDVGRQTARTPATGMRLVSIKSGEGIEE